MIVVADCVRWDIDVPRDGSAYRDVDVGYKSDN